MTTTLLGVLITLAVSIVSLLVSTISLRAQLDLADSLERLTAKVGSSSSLPNLTFSTDPPVAPADGAVIYGLHHPNKDDIESAEGARVLRLHRETWSPYA